MEGEKKAPLGEEEQQLDYTEKKKGRRLTLEREEAFKEKGGAQNVVLEGKKFLGMEKSIEREKAIEGGKALEQKNVLANEMSLERKMWIFAS